MAEISNLYIQDIRDSFRYIEQMPKGGLSNFPPLIITCAITGGIHGKEVNMNLPESVEEQVIQARDACNAGASMLHIHRRNPENLGLVSMKAEEYLEVNARIREACPEVIINNTVMGGRRLIVENGEVTLTDRLIGALPSRPEVASIDLFSHYSISFKKARKAPLTGRPEDIMLHGGYLMKYEDAIESLALCDKYDIKPEFEMNDINDLKIFNRIIRTYTSKKPYWMQMLVNGQGNFPAPEVMMTFARMLPPDVLLSVIGLGIAQIPVITLAMIFGFHVRVGFEDNVWYEKGKLLESNAQMVEKVVRIAAELGRPIATPAQAREMMGLSPTPRAYEYYEGIKIEY